MARGQDSLPVPAYLPASVRRVLPWARQHLVRVCRRYRVSRDDVWDEIIAALLRASLHHDTPERISLQDRYTRTAVHRACWRYVARRQYSRVAAGMLMTMSLHEIDERLEHDAGRAGQRRTTMQNPDLALELASAS